MLAAMRRTTHIKIGGLYHNSDCFAALLRADGGIQKIADYKQNTAQYAYY